MARHLGLGDSWWVTDEGQQYKDLTRRVSTVRLSARTEPKSKKAQRNNELRELMLSDVQLWHEMDMPGARWPRPRAAVAIDIWCRTSNRNPPRIDKLCKWLLDQLGGAQGRPIIFNDDRQVKMLFAQLEANAELTNEPSIDVTAQTVAKVQEGIRRAAGIDEPWTAMNASFELERALGEQYGFSDEDATELVGLYEGDNSEFGREQHARALYDRELKVQQRLLANTDNLTAMVVTAYADERQSAKFGLTPTAQALEWLASSPYVLDLGLLPEKPGDGEAFKLELRARLITLVTDRPSLFPLLSAVGLTIFYVESATGKDLDNIFLEVLPTVLDTLKPPVETVHQWSPSEIFSVWDDARKGKIPPPGNPSVSFIEALALSDIDSVQFPPGSVVLALSLGGRRSSWWRSATSYVEDQRS